MKNGDTLYGIYRNHNVSIQELSALVGSQTSEIILAAQGGAGNAALRQRIAEALGARCWEELLHGSNWAVRTKADARLNMRCLVVLEDEEPQLLHRDCGVQMYLFDGLFYVESRPNGKLYKRQFSDKGTAFGEYLCAIARG